MKAESPALWPRLMDLHLSARYLSVAESTVRDWIHAGLLRAVAMPGSCLRDKAGRVIARPRDRKLVKILIARETLDAFVDRLKGESL